MEHHGEALHELKVDREFVKGLKKDYREVDLSPKTKAFIEYAKKLTMTPQSILHEDVEVMRELGSTDREILDVCQITSYFNFVNRLAHGLGVELEQEL